MNETQESTQEMNITQLAASMGITDVQLAQVLGKRNNHPLYKTASQEYGKGAFEHRATNVSNRAGAFTKGFVGGPARDCGLNVSMDKSRVAKNPGALGPQASSLL